jgi:hypothetical protein
VDKVTVFDQAPQMLNVEFRDGQCCRCLVNNLFLGGFELLLGCIFEIVNLAAVIPKPAIAELSKERFASIEMEELQSLTLELSLVYSPLTAQLRENVRRLAPRISTLFGA